MAALSHRIPGADLSGRGHAAGTGHRPRVARRCRGGTGAGPAGFQSANLAWFERTAADECAGACLGLCVLSGPAALVCRSRTHAAGGLAERETAVRAPAGAADHDA